MEKRKGDELKRHCEGRRARGGSLKSNAYLEGAIRKIRLFTNIDKKGV